MTYHNAFSNMNFSWWFVLLVCFCIILVFGVYLLLKKEVK